MHTQTRFNFQLWNEKGDRQGRSTIASIGLFSQTLQGVETRSSGSRRGEGTSAKTILLASRAKHPLVGRRRHTCPVLSTQKSPYKPERSAPRGTVRGRRLYHFGRNYKGRLIFTLLHKRTLYFRPKMCLFLSPPPPPPKPIISNSEHEEKNTPK